MPDKVLQPGDEGYIAPPSQQPNQEPPAPVEGDNLPKNQEPPEYVDAKEKFSELYQKWNAMDADEQNSDDGKPMSAELGRLHKIIISYEDPAAFTQEGGENTKPPLGVDEHDDFTSQTTVGDINDVDLPSEQTVDKAGRPAGFNPFYHGDAVVNPDNEILHQMDSEEYYKNLNKENR